MSHALGRNFRHDPRSLRYKAPVTGAIASASWTRHIPILDQGELGSCTGNAGTGILGTDGLWQTLDSTDQGNLNEKYAVQLYSDATKIDDDPKNYPPTDTGSDGLSIAQVLKARGLISGYTHITSLAAAHTAIQTGPFITGVNWYNAMFDPDSNGFVTIGGGVAGGHEFEIVAYDALKGWWKFANSWGTSWGADGYAYMSDATYARLLAEQGDATILIPATQPAPTPTPAPIPTPGSPLATARTVLDPWAAQRHTGANAAAANAWKTYVSSQA